MFVGVLLKAGNTDGKEEKKEGPEPGERQETGSGPEKKEEKEEQPEAGEPEGLLPGSQAQSLDRPGRIILKTEGPSGSYYRKAG